jgi:hypothetical protein
MFRRRLWNLSQSTNHRLLVVLRNGHNAAKYEG